MAEAELRQALASEPHEPYAHAFLALCLAQRQQWNEATTEVQHAIHLAPDFAFAHSTLASVLVERNRFDEALVAICEALRLEPEAADRTYPKRVTIVTPNEQADPLRARRDDAAR